MRLNQAIRKWARNLRSLVRSSNPSFMGEAEAGSLYYPIVSSCQIPQLGFLFSHFLGERSTGTFVEVGAFDGVTFSNTYGLAVRGWRGIYVEPQPEFAKTCRKNHAEHNVVVSQQAITHPGQSLVRLQLAGPLTTANGTLGAEYASVSWAKHALLDKILEVPAYTLDALLEEYQVESEFDLLVIDVEGSESAVLAGFDLGKYRPSMIIIELVDTHPDLHSTSASDYRSRCLIESTGYILMFKDSINSVFIRADITNSILGDH